MLLLLLISQMCPFAFSTRLIWMTYSRNSFISSWKSLVAIVGKQVYASSENRKMHSLSTKQVREEFFHKIPWLSVEIWFMFRIRRPPSSQNLPIGWANCQKSQCIIYQSSAVIKVLRLVFGQVHLLAYVAWHSRFIKSDVCENCEKSLYLGFTLQGLLSITLSWNLPDDASLIYE